MIYRKKLIEVALPLEAINREAAREKSIRHGHPSTLHLWWARRPLAACRAVLFASLVDDPSSRPDEFPTEEAQEQERKRLFGIIEELVKWENVRNERVLLAARQEILKSTNGNPPPVLDPFCGGGSIPLEAQRLGLKVCASDLNPVAVLITKALIEIPPRFAGRPPVNPEARRSLAHEGSWTGAAGLAADVRYYGQWMRDEAEERIGHLYPKVDPLPPTPHTACRSHEVATHPTPIKGEGEEVERWNVPEALHAKMVELARTFRKEPTRSEAILWEAIRRKQLKGRRFRRQQPIGPFVVDFFCPSERLIVEVDGPIHETQREADRQRQELLEALDLRFVRVTAAQVEKDLPSVLTTIQNAFSPSPLVGEGDRGRGGMTVIAWLWARTVKCPNPACGATMPLVRSFHLSTKAGKKAWVEPVVNKEKKIVRFEVKMGSGAPPESTVNRRGARCIVCNQHVPFNHVRAEGKAGRMGAQLMAIVAEGKRGRIYLPPSEEHAAVAAKAKPAWAPETDLPQKALGFRVQLYGMTKHRDLFTPRQLVALTTFSDLVSEARERVRKDAIAAGLSDDCTPLHSDGTGATAYADAVAVYLSIGISRSANTHCSLAIWSQSRDQSVNAFSRQAIPMNWDFPEVNPFADAAGDMQIIYESIAKTLESLNSMVAASVFQFDAAQYIGDVEPSLICSDPPYYDNIGYADLSDFFYVWLRRSLGEFYPDLFSTLLTPKTQELIATPYRFGDDMEKAGEHFLTGLRKAFQRMRECSHHDYPLTVFYAFKQTEEDEDNDGDSSSAIASTGWETMLEGLLTTGFQIIGTWPMRTERPTGVKDKVNALASSIVLVCRSRAEDTPLSTRREFITALRRELPDALRKLQQGNVAPVDFAQASIGPGMAIFSRYAKVLEADGSPMRVRAALQLINQELDAYLAEQEGDFDTDTRFCVAWFEQRGMEEGVFGEADVLARAKNTAVEGLVRAGVLEAKAGKVRLLRREEYPENWSPAEDNRLTVWEGMQHLICALERGGEEAASRLSNLLGGGRSEDARALAYRLYAICERKGWAQEALAYNTLVVSWTDVQAKTASVVREGEQTYLFGGGDKP